MKVVYEIRTSRGIPMFRFDLMHRAIQEAENSSKRLGTNLYLFRVTTTEEEVLYTGVQ